LERGILREWVFVKVPNGVVVGDVFGINKEITRGYNEERSYSLSSREDYPG
jgi:hypothetical protein